MRSWRMCSNVREFAVERHEDSLFAGRGCCDDGVVGTREPFLDHCDRLMIVRSEKLDEGEREVLVELKPHSPVGGRGMTSSAARRAP